jgi:hypothetical protein
MPIDLKFDFAKGDLAIAPNKDIDRAIGSGLVEQRIKVRLMIVQGEWVDDPTGGQIGSRLRDALRMPLFRAEAEIPLLVNEALDPMTDILVSNVIVTPNATDNSALDITIIYSTVDDTGASTQEDLSTTITLAG